MVKTISTYTTAIEAYIAKGRLEAEGIPAYIADEHYISAQWTVSQAIGGVRLQVPTSLAPQAIIVITKIKRGSYELPLSKKLIESEAVYCPKCNSNDTYSVDWIWKLSFVFMFMSIFPLPFSRHRFKCNNCTNSWIATEHRSHSIFVQIFASLLVALAVLSLFFFLYYWRCKLYYCLQ